MSESSQPSLALVSDLSGADPLPPLIAADGVLQPSVSTPDESCATETFCWPTPPFAVYPAASPQLEH